MCSQVMFDLGVSGGLSNNRFRICWAPAPDGTTSVAAMAEHDSAANDEDYSVYQHDLGELVFIGPLKWPLLFCPQDDTCDFEVRIIQISKVFINTIII